MKEKIALRIPGYTSFFILLLYLVYYLNQVDTSLIYYWQQSIAKTIGEALQYPGGLSELLGDHVIGLFANSITGSISLGILVFGLFISLAFIFRSHKDKPLFFVLLTASIIPVFFLFPDYKLPFYLFTDIFLAILLSAFYTLYSLKNRILKFKYLFVSGGLVFLFTGIPGLIIFFQINLIRIIISKEYVDVISILSLALIPILYLPINLSYSLKVDFLLMLAPTDFLLPKLYYVFLFIPSLFFLSLVFLNYILAIFLNKWPALTSWAADGNSLYYISSDPYSDTLPYNATAYNLMSISYDKVKGKFGSSDTLIDADYFGKSISYPRESPKGNLIAFIGLDYGYFSIFNHEADVYFFNTETREINKPEINSEFTESYPSWSADGS